MTINSEILKKLKSIYANVQRQKLVEPTAVTLSTADPRGSPSARVVLLKGFDENGFVIYTNFNSRKGQELQKNPWAALTFFWDALDDQIRIEGKVVPVSNEEADAYWVTRPRDSQIGAWASLQSSELNSRATFLGRIAKFAVKFGTKQVPRPSHWSGFRVVPHRVEFWKRKPFRLHERLVYDKTKSGWVKTFLYP